MATTTLTVVHLPCVGLTLATWSREWGPQWRCQPFTSLSIGPCVRNEAGLWEVTVAGESEVLERFRAEAEKEDVSMWCHSLYGLDDYSSDQVRHLRALLAKRIERTVRSWYGEGGNLWAGG